ncbi:Rho termination factor N-terminal domain-containing protein [Acholeplasma granularum]|uniref:Rho termination factor N-terminal domain-containing protein n=1 Tax=Acholeplasma granularum TaxID=264635 RepID=UPI0004713443|nr:Rho termination factor N-terminal domain-containing protein [Acholeplasma granularum]
MAIINKEGLIVTRDSKYQVSDLIQRLSFISETYVLEFLQSIGLSVPRKLRMNALKDVLKEPVAKTIQERKTLADEMGYRLTWFNKFTDSQLVNLLEWYNSPSLNNHYIQSFWRLLLNYMVTAGVSDTDLNRLFSESEVAYKNNKRPTSNNFNLALDKVLYDEDGEIDGVTQDQFRPVVYKATTLTELRKIGEKYNAPIPKRLKKKEMLDYILEKLTERGELNKQLEEKLKSNNIILLERFAKDHDIKVSTELKKEEIIEYILANAKETKSTYFVPESSDVYELTEEVVEKEQETVIVENVDSQVETSETVAPEKVVQQQVIMTEQIDYRPQFDKLADAFIKLAESFDKKEFNVQVQNQPVVQEPVIKEEVQTQNIKDEAKVVSQDVMINPELIIKELLADEELDLPEEDLYQSATQNPKEENKFKKVYHQRKGLSKLAGFFALIFALGFIWIALLSFGLLIAPFLIEANSFVNTLTAEQLLMLQYGSIAFAVINLIATFALFSNLKRKYLIFWGIITLFSGVIITGLIALLAIGTKTKKVYDEATNDTQRLAEALEKITETKTTKKQKIGSKFSVVLLSIITFVLLVFVILYGIWRLEFTYGYENIPILGPFLRDQIIIPLFGSSHDMAQYF